MCARINGIARQTTSAGLQIEANQTGRRGRPAGCLGSSRSQRELALLVVDREPDMRIILARKLLRLGRCITNSIVLSSRFPPNAKVRLISSAFLLVPAESRGIRREDLGTLVACVI